MISYPFLFWFRFFLRILFQFLIVTAFLMFSQLARHRPALSNETERHEKHIRANFQSARVGIRNRHLLCDLHESHPVRLPLIK